MHKIMLHSNYILLFTLVDLQWRFMGQVEPVNICLGKVLKKSLNWWMTRGNPGTPQTTYLTLG